jgi:anti-anti-sigma factor
MSGGTGPETRLDFSLRLHRRSIVASLDNFPIAWAPGSAIVTLPAEIDICNADDVRDTLLAVLKRGIMLLVIDMTGTTFCDCAGAGAVARAHVRAWDAGGQVRLAAGVPIVRRLLALTGVDRIVPVFDSLAAALAPGPARPERGPAAWPRTERPARWPGEGDPREPRYR